MCLSLYTLSVTSCDSLASCLLLPSNYITDTMYRNDVLFLCISMNVVFTKHEEHLSNLMFTSDKDKDKHI